MSDKFCPRCFEKFGLELDLCPECRIRLVSALDRDLSGKTLDDRYEVIEALGKGGMGVVYRAKQKIIDRPVALKVLRRELVQDESSVRRFLVEAKAVSALRSPHTITLFDFGITQEGLLYFTMELLEGEVLTKLIRSEAPFAPARAARIVTQVCESLKEAHGKGILHRDLKPDNIFLVAGPDGKEHVKVLDFGIAKILDDGTSESITKTGMVCGTPMYLSPEQAVGKSLDSRSDIYSLGIILYEMLAGEPPFVDATPVGILMKQVNERPEPLSARNPNVRIPESLERFLMRVLAKDPDDRPQTVEAMAGELREVMEGKGKEREVPLPGMMTTQAGVQVPTAEYFGSQNPEGGTSPVVEEVERPSAGPSGPVAQEEAETRPSLQMERIEAGGRSRRGLIIGAFIATMVVVGAVLLLLFPPGKQESAPASKGEVAAPAVDAEEAKPAGIPAPGEGPEDALEAERKAEAAARERELSEREALLEEKEAALQREKELAEREKALAEREAAAREAEAAAKQAAAAQAEAAAQAQAEQEAAEAAAKKAAEEAAAAEQSAQAERTQEAEAARKKAEAAKKAAERIREEERQAEARRKQAEADRKKAEEERKKAEEERRKQEQQKKGKDGEPDFEEI